MALCVCPRGQSLTTIPVNDCPVNLAQIQKLAFQRLYKSDGSKNGFLLPADDIKLKASWTSCMTATDDTKIVISPWVQNPTTDPGAARTFGGGNETLSGIPIVLGSDPTTFTAVLRQLPQDLIKILKELACENIGVYLFDADGTIAAASDHATTNKFYTPFHIAPSTFFVSDLILGGHEGVDGNNLQFSLMPNWSDDLVLIKPTDFNPIMDLR